VWGTAAAKISTGCAPSPYSRVGFHFEAPSVLSGFVGVDIFFVISGFLITQIIQSEVHAGTFSFAQFYERRVRRLLPALYAMVALTAIPSFHYLLTSERLEFFRSIAAAVTFTSNFYFWFQAGYFDHAAVEKPLLHTWSLAVEEQFIWRCRYCCGRCCASRATGVGISGCRSH
jgi:peptidoglycan/LPS O-acetylase OafA/YrhL